MRERRVRPGAGPVRSDGSGAASLQEMTTDLPIEFPSETGVILEGVARFRALTPVERFRSLLGLLNAGDRIRKKSLKAAWARQYAVEREIPAPRAIREYFSRHGY